MDSRNPQHDLKVAHKMMSEIMLSKTMTDKEKMAVYELAVIAEGWIRAYENTQGIPRPQQLHA